MDIGLFRSIMTVVLFAAFMGIVLWAWSSKRHGDFEAASRLVVDDSEDYDNTTRKGAR